MSNSYQSLGLPDDIASSVGGSGSVNAKLALMTSQLDTIANKTVTVGTVGQGTGNAGGSPWSVTGSVTVLNASSNNQGTGNAGGSPWAISGAITNAALTDVWDSVNHLIRTKEQGTPTPNQGTGNAGGSPWAISGSVSIAGGSLPVTQSTTPWAVAGQSASGAVANNINPVLAGAISPTNLLRNLQVDSSDNLKVTVSNLTSTSNQGTGNAAGSPWSISGSVSVLGTPNVAVTNQPTVNQGTGNGAGSPWAVSGNLTIAGTQTIQGTISSGSIFIGPPVQIAGVDVGAVVRTLLVNNDGSQPVGGFTTKVNTSLTRPANATQYTANTALANATSSAAQMTFTNCARANGYSGEIRGAKLIDFTNQTTLLQAELWLFDTTLATVTNDNANWAPVSGDIQNLVGIIPFPLNYIGNNNGTAGTGNVVFEAYNICLPFTCGASSRNLFGQLVVRNTYTPVISELLIVRLDIAQD